MMLRAEHLTQYRDLALLLTRYGLKDFRLDFSGPVDDQMLEEPDAQDLGPDVRARAKKFAETLKAMGPTYIKFGQVLSTRPDLVPPPYIDELESLQDDIEPFSFGIVEQVVESELKVKISKAFQQFEATPMAAASLGQVHRAVMRDGRDVVVKVQRPDIREVIRRDLDVFSELTTFLEKHSAVARKMNLAETVEQGRRTLLDELNYSHEARNMELFKRSLAEFPEIYIPDVIHDYSTQKVLTAEFIPGKKVSKLTPIELIDHDYASLAAVLTRAYLKQICVDGFWHSDPHPGNVFLQDGRLILLDFGMVSRLGSELQDQVIKLLLSLTENKGTETAEICMKIGTLQEGFDRNRFVHQISTLVTAYHDADLQETNTGQLLFTLISIANANEVRVPSELAMLAKTLLHLDGITRRLDPDFNPRQVIRDYAESLVAKKVQQKFHPRNFYPTLLDLNELAIELPRRTREIVDQVATGRATVNVSLTQGDHLLKGLQKIANRITVGLIMAAIIIGSSLMMRVPTRLQLFGYPLLAVLGYLAATGIGFYLVFSILMQDRKDREKAKSRPDIL